MEEKKIVISTEELRALINLAAEDICGYKDKMLWTDCKNVQVMDIATMISTRVQMHLDGRWVFDEERIMNYLRVVRHNAVMRDLIAMKNHERGGEDENNKSK